MSLPYVSQIELVVPAPYDAPGVFGFFAGRVVAGVESVESAENAMSTGLQGDTEQLRYARTLMLPNGPGAIELTATGKASEWAVSLRAELTSPDDETFAIELARGLLDLDTDSSAVDGVLASDPVIAPLVARTPGIRVPGSADAHELVVRAIIGQQISVGAARTHLSRLAELAGSPYASSFTGLTRLFPKAEQLLQLIPDPGINEPLDPGRPLRLPRRSIHTLRAVVRALSDGELRVSADSTPEELQTELVALPGIGAWTAAYVSMRVLGDPDAWLIGDVALIAGAKRLQILDEDAPKAPAHRLLAQRAEAWAPWRSYAAMHLWQANTKNRAE